MTSRPIHPLRRAFTPWLAALCLWASLVVPILDAEDWQHGVAIESQHDLSRCVRAHDHTVCAQLSAARALPSEAVRVPRAEEAGFRPAPPAPVDAPRALALPTPLGPRPPPAA